MEPNSCKIRTHEERWGRGKSSSKTKEHTGPAKKVCGWGCAAVAADPAGHHSLHTRVQSSSNLLLGASVGATLVVKGQACAVCQW